jgi:methionyl-tRNA formyltransferase
MRIAFLGNNWLGWKIAEHLSEAKENIECLVLHPPEKRKYGRKIRACVNVDDNVIFEADDLSDPSVTKVISDLKPDLALSVLFGTILNSQFIGMFPLGVINIHPSYLPYNRGAYSNVWSIVDGTPAGTTIHFIDEGVDTGDIIAQTQIPVEPFDTGKSLYEKLEVESLKLFKKTWPKIESGNFERKKQTREGGTFHYVSEVEQIDEIYLEKKYTANDLLNILRARTFPPYPGAFIRHKGQKIFLKLEMIPEKETERG